MIAKFSEIRALAFEGQQLLPFHHHTINHFTTFEGAQEILKSGIIKGRFVPQYTNDFSDGDEETEERFISFTDIHFWDKPQSAKFMRDAHKKSVFIAFKNDAVKRAGAEKVQYTKSWFDNHMEAIPYILDAPLFSEEQYQKFDNGKDEDQYDVEEKILKQALIDFKNAKIESEWILSGDFKFDWNDVAYISSRSEEILVKLKKAFPDHADKIISHTSNKPARLT